MVSSNKGSGLGGKGGNFFQDSRAVKIGVLVCFELCSLFNKLNTRATGDEEVLDLLDLLPVISFRAVLELDSDSLRLSLSGLQTQALLGPLGISFLQSLAMG